jgi:hypothetical protein
VVPAQVLERTFYIQHGGHLGTAFTLEVSSRQFLVTARHVVDGLEPGGSIGIHIDGEWTPLRVEPIWCSLEAADVAVLSPPRQLSPVLPLPSGMDGAFYGQDMYLLGYPYTPTAGTARLSSGQPLPFARRAALATWTKDIAPDRNVLFLDAYANPGFSGGPVVFAADGGHSRTDYRVAGVISHYVPEEQPVFLRGEATPLIAQANPGLVVAHDVRHALDAIASAGSGLGASVAG